MRRISGHCTREQLMLMELEVLLLDEVSMIDETCWHTIAQLLAVIDHSRRPDDDKADAYGNVRAIACFLLAVLCAMFYNVSVACACII